MKGLSPERHESAIGKAAEVIRRWRDRGIGCRDLLLGPASSSRPEASTEKWLQRRRRFAAPSSLAAAPLHADLRDAASGAARPRRSSRRPLEQAAAHQLREQVDCGHGNDDDDHDGREVVVIEGVEGLEQELADAALRRNQPKARWLSAESSI